MDNEFKNEGRRKAEDLIIKNLRTFEDDIKNIVDKEKLSTTDILVSEQKKRLKQLEKQKNEALKPRKVIEVPKITESPNKKVLNEIEATKITESLSEEVLNEIEAPKITEAPSKGVLNKIETPNRTPNFQNFETGPINFTQALDERAESEIFAEKEEKKINKKSPRNYKIILISVFLIGISLVVFYVSINFKDFFLKLKEKPIEVQTSSLIMADKTLQIDTLNKTAREIIGNLRDEIKKETLAEENDLIELAIVKRIKIKTANDSEEKILLSKITNADFFKLIESEAEDSLIRSFSPEITIGVHQKKNGLEPFIVMKVNSFEESFAGMLDWEGKIISEIKDIFYDKLGSSQVFVGEKIKTKPEEITTSSSTASSTVPLSMSTTTASSTLSTASTTPVIEIITYDPEKFEDLILLNKDVRVVKNTSGEILFFYSFINRENLIMTTNVETFDLVLKRLNISKLIR